MKKKDQISVLMIIGSIVLVVSCTVLFFLFHNDIIAYEKKKRTINNEAVNYASNLSSLSSSIMALDPNVTPTISLNDVTEFDWDKVYFFEAYTSAVLIEETIGIEWYGFRDSLDDGDMQIVFVNQDKIACYCNEPAYNPRYCIKYNTYLVENNLHSFIATPESQLEFSIERFERQVSGEYTIYLSFIGCL